MYSYEGKFVNTFGSRGTGDGQLKGPCGIAIDHEERLVISDRDNHRVQVFDLEPLDPLTAARFLLDLRNN